MKNDGTMVNAFVPGKGNLSAEDQALVARRAKAMGPAYRLFYETPVHLVRGDGVWLYDKDGNAYLDTYNNVASVGHCHPHVVAATAQQAATFASHTRYLHDGAGLCRTVACVFPARTQPCDVHLHRVRGQ
jgi:4-aminobutyrate aminotransferase-like enzyme